MKFEVELLTKNISITKLGELFLSSEIIDVISDNIDKLVKKNNLSKYKCSFEGNDFTVITQQIPSGIVKISLIYEYSKDKFNSAKKFGRLFSKFTEFLGKNHLKYSVLSNNLSTYFSQRLYPKFQRYESILRKIFVLALSPLEDENIIEIIKKETNNRIDLSKIHTMQYIENLQMAELHTLIFELNLNQINSLSIHFKNFENKSNHDLKKLINTALPITVWERHFVRFTNNEGKDIHKNNYDKIREYRNDVMHFHMISYKRYQKIDSLLSDVSMELEILENNMLQKWDFEATRKLVNDISNQELLVDLVKIVSEGIKPAMDSFYANNVNLNVGLKSMVAAFNKIQVPKIDSRVLKSIQGISDTIGHLDLPNTPNELNSEEEDEEYSCQF